MHGRKQDGTGEQEQHSLAHRSKAWAGRGSFRTVKATWGGVPGGGVRVPSRRVPFGRGTNAAEAIAPASGTWPERASPFWSNP